MGFYDWKYLEDFTFSDFEIVHSDYEEYINVPMSFDIETTSFFKDIKTGETFSITEYFKRIKENPEKQMDYVKQATMYIWQFAIKENVFYGRTWEDFYNFLHILDSKLQLSELRYAIVYVHNLSYEFQFMRKRFNWLDVFTVNERSVLYCKCEGIVFKCSYMLSGYSLDKLADNLQDSDIKKMVGDLDYKTLRNSVTPLTEKELGYCFNDVLIVTAYIKEQIKLYGKITDIPLTNTGRVRRYVRNATKENPKYRLKMKDLTFDGYEYKMLRNAFNGGYTHCNAMYTDFVLDNIASYDINSSYPAVMVMEKFPMSKGARVQVKDAKDFERMCDRFCVLADVVFFNIKIKPEYTNIISLSKCTIKNNPITDNGKVERCDMLGITVTDVEFKNILRFYDFDYYTVGCCYVYKRGYLPIEIIKCILNLYSNKTMLKGVTGREAEYVNSKTLLNAVYGMCVYNPMKDRFIYSTDKDEWNTTQPNMKLDEYNEDKARFLSYAWGVWVTSYARNNLFDAIYECKDDFVYSDTDSIKMLHSENHLKFFENYNKNILKKLEAVQNHYKIESDLIKPKTINGVEKVLGVWDYEGNYDYFKSLGAKRYLAYKNNNFDFVVSGVNKKYALPYMQKKTKGDAKAMFNLFSLRLMIPRQYTGKLTHSYIDSVTEGVLVDYLGNKAEYKENSSVHLMETEYSFNSDDDYLRYFFMIQSNTNYHI